jgi:putative transposase
MTLRSHRAPKDRLKPIGADLIQTRRWLPHWQQGGATYFVTFRTATVEPSTDLRSVVLSGVRHFDDRRYTLWATVVMPDHAHLLLAPLEQESGQWWSLSSIMHSLKAHSAKQVNQRLQRSGAVWMQESFDRIIRDADELVEKWQYIRNNPVKRGLCQRPEDWDAFYERSTAPLTSGTG